MQPAPLTHSALSASAFSFFLPHLCDSPSNWINKTKTLNSRGLAGGRALIIHAQQRRLYSAHREQGPLPSGPSEARTPRELLSMIVIFLLYLWPRHKFGAGLWPSLDFIFWPFLASGRGSYGSCWVLLCFYSCHLRWNGPELSGHPRTMWLEPNARNIFHYVSFIETTCWGSFMTWFLH